MAKEKNLKVNVTADTSAFAKGMKQAKSDLRDFSKVTESSLNGIGNLFGVNTGKIQQMQGALRGLGQQMTQAGGEGAAAFGKMLTSISGVGGAIAGLGLAAVVANFKALKAEAEAFKQTVDGASMAMATAAYTETYLQSLRDMNKEMGRSSAEFFDEWERRWARLKGLFGQWATQGFSFRPDTVIGLWAENKGAVANAEKAAEYAKIIHDRQRDLKKLENEIAEIDAQIAEQRRIMADTTATAAQRAEALRKAEELINQKYELRKPIVDEIANAYTKMGDLATNTEAAEDAIMNAQRATADLAREYNTELRAIQRQASGINKELAQEVALRRQAADLARQAASSRASMAGAGSLTAISGSPIDSSAVRGTSTPIITPVIDPSPWVGFFEGADAALYKRFPNGLALGIAFDAEQGLVDLTNQVNQAMGMLADSIGQSLGQLMGDLATGEDAWGNFANAAMSAFGDMAVSVGKMAISTGIATLGIKAALKSLNGYVAIAAGVALVALGTAVKAGLGNIASGNYSAAPSVASSGYTGGMSATDFDTRESTVNVTGTLRADGATLTAVLSNTANRQKHTT